TAYEVFTEFRRVLFRSGDADADGFADVLIGSPDADTLYGVDSGRVDLYSGISSLALRTWTGKAAKDQFGASVSGGHDLDGDGLRSAERRVGKALRTSGA